MCSTILALVVNNNWLVRIQREHPATTIGQGRISVGGGGCTAHSSLSLVFTSCTRRASQTVVRKDIPGDGRAPL